MSNFTNLKTPYQNAKESTIATTADKKKDLSKITGLLFFAFMLISTYYNIPNMNRFITKMINAPIMITAIRVIVSSRTIFLFFKSTLLRGLIIIRIYQQDTVMSQKSDFPKA